MNRITTKDLHRVAHCVAAITSQNVTVESWMNHYTICINGYSIVRGITRRECVERARAWIEGYVFAKDEKTTEDKCNA